MTLSESERRVTLHHSYYRLNRAFWEIMCSLAKEGFGVTTRHHDGEMILETLVGTFCGEQSIQGFLKGGYKKIFNTRRKRLQEEGFEKEI